MVAIHFSATGTPGNYVSRTLAVFGMSVVMLVTMVVMKSAARIDPPNDPRAFDVVVCSTMVLFAGVRSFALGWNLGYRVPFGIVLAGVAVWTVFVVGYTLVHEKGI